MHNVCHPLWKKTKTAIDVVYESYTVRPFKSTHSNTRSIFMLYKVGRPFDFLLEILKGHVTRGNFSCNLRRNKHCVACCRKDFQSRVKLHFCNLQMQQKVALRVARKVELSSPFRNVARQVAACDMSIVTCNAIVWKWASQSASFARGWFQAGDRRKNCKQFPPGALQVAKKYRERVTPLCNLQCFSVIIVALQVASREKILPRVTWPKASWPFKWQLPNSTFQ